MSLHVESALEASQTAQPRGSETSLETSLPSIASQATSSEVIFKRSCVMETGYDWIHVGS